MVAAGDTPIAWSILIWNQSTVSRRRDSSGEVEGDVNTVLVPEDRYAQMRNVWFLPSVPALELWLRRAGFTDVRSVDISRTSVEEQRATQWMRYQSLPDFLDPQDHSRTIEGLPAPLRATLVARKP